MVCRNVTAVCGKLDDDSLLAALDSGAVWLVIANEAENAAVRCEIKGKERTTWIKSDVAAIRPGRRLLQVAPNELSVAIELHEQSARSVDQIVWARRRSA